MLNPLSAASVATLDIPSIVAITYFPFFLFCYTSSVSSRRPQRTEHLKRHIEVHHENDLFTEKIDDYIIKRFRKDKVKLLKIAVELREMHSEEPEMVKYFTKNRILNRWMQLRKKGH